MLLAQHVGEALGSETPVEGLVNRRGLVWHDDQPTAWVRRRIPAPGPITGSENALGARRDGQAICGTRNYPLRAAAVRP
jgi:hypothetical protein